MEVLYPACARLDVHKKTVVASICLTDPRGRATFRTRTFGTTTPDLLDLQAWLAGWPSGHPCGDGGHRLLLEAGV